jgi:hypothetical protein
LAQFRQEIAAVTFDLQDGPPIAPIGPGEMQFTVQNYARTPMIEQPRRLTNPTARQFRHLDAFQRENQQRHDQLYQGGGDLNHSQNDV